MIQQRVVYIRCAPSADPVKDKRLLFYFRFAVFEIKLKMYSMFLGEFRFVLKDFQLNIDSVWSSVKYQVDTMTQVLLVSVLQTWF